MMDKYGGVLLQPNVNFAQVRDGRRSPLFYYDVPLDTARSVAAGTALILSVSGDSFYVDKNPSVSGAATVHFQDTTSGIAPAPVYCEPGFIANVPFTQIAIENTAQAGKVFRFFYGVGIDFQPGAASTIVISGGVSVADDLPATSEHWLKESGALGVGTLVTPVFLPAANVSGAVIDGVSYNVLNNSAGTVAVAFIAALTAPVSIATKSNSHAFGVFYADNTTNSASTRASHKSELILKRTIPAGWGLWLVERVGVGAATNIISSVEYYLS